VLAIVYARVPDKASKKMIGGRVLQSNVQIARGMSFHVVKEFDCTRMHLLTNAVLTNTILAKLLPLSAWKNRGNHAYDNNLYYNYSTVTITFML